MTTDTREPFVATEIERAAVTMLTQAHVTHPILRQWIAAIARDPSEQRSIDRFTPSGDAAEYCAAAGYAAAGTIRETARNHATLAPRADAPEFEGLTPPRRWHRVNGWLDVAALDLGTAIVLYRLDGRPTGDVTTFLHDGPMVTSSLAARVAEFALEVQRAYEDALFETFEAARHAPAGEG